MEIIKCPLCGAKIEIFEDTELGDVVYCEECDREFEVISLDPIKLKLLEEDID